MGQTGWITLLIIGFLIIGGSIYIGIQPSILPASCSTQSCSLGASGLGFLLGMIFIIGGGIAHHRLSSKQTVIIAMGTEAESDAQTLTQLETAVGRGQSGESFVPTQKKDKLVVPPEVFAALSRDKMSYSKEAKKKQPPRKQAKQQPIRLPKDILRVAKRSAAKKKK